MTLRKVSCFVLFVCSLLLGSPKMLSSTQREGGVGSCTKALVPVAPVSNMSERVPCTLTADEIDPQPPLPPVMMADGTDPLPPLPPLVRTA